MIRLIKECIKRKNRQKVNMYLCSCGNIFNASSYDVKRGHTKSCGCYKSIKENNPNYKHGESITESISPEYRCWNHIKWRCLSKDCPAYKNYGGRGIKVCERWLNSFENFLSDMGRRPSNNHSIERINNNGDYEPSNCKWATDEEQRLNKRCYHKSGRCRHEVNNANS